jgi:hypothetical protein
MIIGRTYDQLLVFSVMCNDQTGRMSSTRVIDQIVSILAAYPEAPK